MSDVLHALPAGYKLEEYRIERVLGSGGFGITYLATDTNLQKSFAIKEYLPIEFAGRDHSARVRPRSGGDSETFQWGMQRFLQEAQTLARFEHPNIVDVRRFFQANGTAYLVMEYQRGESLSAVLKRHAADLSEQEILDIALPLLDGLAQVHRVGFLHRDIKPGNIFINEGGEPVLLDFGAAREVLGRQSRSLTNILTPGFAPFEQYFAGGKQGPYTDIYAFGAVLYYAITGETPPEAPARVRQDPYVPAAQLAREGFSPHLLAAIDRALAVTAEDRPQSCEEWRAMLLGERAAAAAAASQSDAGQSTLFARAEPPPAPERPSAGSPSSGRRRNDAVPPSPPSAIERGETLSAGRAAAGRPRRTLAYAAGAAALLLAAAAGAWFTVGRSPSPTISAGPAPDVRGDRPPAAIGSDAERSEEARRRTDRAKGLVDDAQSSLQRARRALAEARLRDAKTSLDEAGRLARAAGEVDPEGAATAALRRDHEALAREVAAAIKARVEALVAQARRDVAEKFFDAARRKLEEALALDAGASGIDEARAELARAEEDEKRAARDRAERLRALLANAQTYLDRAKQAIAAGQPSDARSYAEQMDRMLRDAAAIDSTSPDIADLRRAYALLLRDIDAALLAARVADLLGQARRDVADRQFEAARRKLDEAAKLNPQAPGLGEARAELARAEDEERRVARDRAQRLEQLITAVRSLVQQARSALAQGRLLEARDFTDRLDATLRDAARFDSAETVVAFRRDHAALVRDVDQAVAARVADLVAQARRDVADKAFDAARRKLDEAAALDAKAKDVPAARAELARAEDEERRLARERAQKFEQALAAARTALDQARKALAGGQIGEARKGAEQLERNLRDAAALNSAAAAVVALRRDYDGLIRDIDRAAELRAAELLRQARQDIAEKRFDAARRKLEDAAALAPKDPSLGDIRAELARAEDDDKRAARDRAERLDKLLAAARTALEQARKLLAAARWADARALAEQAGQALAEAAAADAQAAGLAALKREHGALERDIERGVAARIADLVKQARRDIAGKQFDAARQRLEEAEAIDAKAREVGEARAELAKAEADQVRSARERAERVEKLLASAKDVLEQARTALAAGNLAEARRLADQLDRALREVQTFDAAADDELRKEHTALLRGIEQAVGARVTQLVGEARRYIANKDFDAARRKLDEAAKLDARSRELADARAELARADVQSREALERQQRLERILATARTQLDQAKKLLADVRLLDAKAIGEQLARTLKSAGDLGVPSAELAALRRDYESFDRDLVARIEKRVDELVDRARQEMRAGRLDAAEQRLNEAATLDPRAAEVRQTRAELQNRRAAAAPRPTPRRPDSAPETAPRPAAPPSEPPTTTTAPAPAPGPAPAPACRTMKAC